MEDLKVKEIEVHKLSLKPGEVLMITIKDDDVETHSLEALNKHVKTLFPNNKVCIMCVSSNDDVKFTIVDDKTTHYTEEVGLSSHFANKE